MAGGRYEERVRTWIGRRTAGRGERTRLAAHLQRQRAWVTKYVNRQVDADLDTVLAMAAYFGVTLDALVGATPPVPRDRRSEDERDLLTQWQQVPARDRPLLRGIIDLYVRGAAATRSARARGRAPQATARSRRSPR